MCAPFALYCLVARSHPPRVVHAVCKSRPHTGIDHVVLIVQLPCPHRVFTVSSFTPVPNTYLPNDHLARLEISASKMFNEFLSFIERKFLKNNILHGDVRTISVRWCFSGFFSFGHNSHLIIDSWPMVRETCDGRRSMFTKLKKNILT